MFRVVLSKDITLKERTFLYSPLVLRVRFREEVVWREGLFRNLFASDEPQWMFRVFPRLEEPSGPLEAIRL